MALAPARPELTPPSATPPFATVLKHLKEHYYEHYARKPNSVSSFARDLHLLLSPEELSTFRSWLQGKHKRLDKHHPVMVHIELVWQRLCLRSETSHNEPMCLDDNTALSPHSRSFVEGNRVKWQ